MVSITRDCILEKYHKSKASPAAVKMARKRTVRSRRKLRRILSPGMVAPFGSVDPGSSMRLRPRCQDGFRESPFRNLLREAQRFLYRNGAALQPLRQVLTLHQLEDEEELPVQLFETIDRSDVGMIQR